MELWSVASSSYFFADNSSRSHRKSDIFIIWKVLSRPKYPINTIFYLDNRSTGGNSYKSECLTCAVHRIADMHSPRLNLSIAALVSTRCYTHTDIFKHETGCVQAFQYKENLDSYLIFIFHLAVVFPLLNKIGSKIWCFRRRSLLQIFCLAPEPWK